MCAVTQSGGAENRALRERELRDRERNKERDKINVGETWNCDRFAWLSFSPCPGKVEEQESYVCMVFSFPPRKALDEKSVRRRTLDTSQRSQRWVGYDTLERWLVRIVLWWDVTRMDQAVGCEIDPRHCLAFSTLFVAVKREWECRRLLHYSNQGCAAFVSRSRDVLVVPPRPGSIHDQGNWPWHERENYRHAGRISATR